MKIFAVSIAENIKNNKILYVILLGSFLASLTYAFYFRIRPVVDARAYDAIAVNIAGGNGYREDLSKDITRDYAIARVGPLYEYFLAGIYKFFGHSYSAVWIIQALLRALSAGLVYLAALLVFAEAHYCRRVALLAAAIFGFYPDLIEISAMLMTETLYLFFICLMLYSFFCFFQRAKYWLAVILGAVAGLAVLARPPVLFLLPVMMFCFLKKKKFLSVVIFICVFILVLTPWTTRNYQVYKQFMPFGAAGNFNFWIGNYYGGSGEQEPREEHYSFVATHPVKEINAQSLHQFKQFLQQYPGEFIKLTALRISKYFSLIRPMGFWFYQTGLGQALFIFSSALASVLLFIFGGGGFWLSIKQRSEKPLYLAALAIATPLILFITVVETRYRFQVYPLLAIFAAYFAVKLWTEKKWWVSRVLWASIAIFSANTLLDIFLSIEKLKEKLGPFF